MKIRRRVRPRSYIPTASMADIAMLLLIFFMSTSIIRTEEQFQVRLPGATTGERVRRETAIRVALSPAGEVTLNDARVRLEDVGAVLAEKVARNPSLTVSMHADARTPYALVSKLLDELKEASAPRVALAVEKRSSR